MQTLTNQKSKTVCSWLLTGLNLYERMWINQKQSHFWAPGCNLYGKMIIKLIINSSDDDDDDDVFIDKDNVYIKLKTINEVLEHHLTFRLKDRKVVLHANPLARNHNLVLSSRQYILWDRSKSAGKKTMDRNRAFLYFSGVRLFFKTKMDPRNLVIFNIRLCKYYEIRRCLKAISAVGSYVLHHNSLRQQNNSSKGNETGINNL